MATINTVMMVGRLARDPELRQIRENMSACKMTIVTEYKTRTKEGIENKEICYIDCTTWNKEAEYCAKKFKKGSFIAVEGRLKLEKWLDKTTNQERTKHVIVPENITCPSDLSQEDEVRTTSTVSRPVQPARPQPKQVLEQEEEFDDSLPF